MNLFELTAASTFLSYFSDEITYSALINRLKNDEFWISDDDAIDPWQPFEYHTGEFIAECIESLHEQLLKSFQIKNNTLNEVISRCN